MDQIAKWKQLLEQAKRSKDVNSAKELSEMILKAGGEIFEVSPEISKTETQRLMDLINQADANGDVPSATELRQKLAGLKVEPDYEEAAKDQAFLEDFKIEPNATPAALELMESENIDPSVFGNERITVYMVKEYVQGKQNQTV